MDFRFSFDCKFCIYDEEHTVEQHRERVAFIRARRHEVRELFRASGKPDPFARSRVPRWI